MDFDMAIRLVKLACILFNTYVVARRLRLEHLESKRRKNLQNSETPEGTE